MESYNDKVKDITDAPSGKPDDHVKNTVSRDPDAIADAELT